MWLGHSRGRSGGTADVVGRVRAWYEFGMMTGHSIHETWASSEMHMGDVPAR